jgi:hypothetical protein
MKTLVQLRAEELIEQGNKIRDCLVRQASELGPHSTNKERDEMWANIRKLEEHIERINAFRSKWVKS